MNVLIIEDDKETASYIAKGFSEIGYVSDIANTGTQGLHLAQTGRYDVLIIDRMLPELDGLSAIKQLRKEKNNVPILVLSALGEVDYRIEGLDAGGDDYLVKPYVFSELLARVQALTRRRCNDDQNEIVLEIADLKLDRVKRLVTRGGKKINLQPREFNLLEYLMSNAGQTITRTMLLEKVWGYHFDPQTNVIDVHISRLRSKVDKDFKIQLIHTVRCSGYSLYDPREN